MRPYQTFALITLIVAAAVFIHLRNIRTDPRAEKLANAYVELAVLHQLSDTTTFIYDAKRDSILAKMGLDEKSFLGLEDELKQEPARLIEVWDLVEKKLKARKESLDIIKQ